MKKVLLLLAAIMALSINAHADTVVFKATTATYSGDCTNVISAATNTSQTTQNATLGDICDIKFSKAALYTDAIRIYGSTTTTITPKEGITITKITFAANGSYSTSILSKTSSSDGTYSNGTWTGSTTKAVAFSASAQFRCNYIEITYTKESLVTVPALPVVTFNGTTAKNNETYEVTNGTVVNISSNGAESLYILDDEFNETNVNGNQTTVTITKDCTLYITGKNVNGESELMEVGFTVSKEIVTPPTPGTGNKYKLVTSAADLVAGCKYIIVCENKNKTMASAVASSNIGATDITITNHTADVDDETLVLILGGTSGSWTLAFDNYKGTGKYLSAANSGTALNKSTSAGTCSISIDANGNAAITFSNSTSRKISYGGSDFRNYATDNIPKTYPYIQLYKQDTAPTDPVEYTPIFAPISLYPDETSTIVLPGEDHPVVSYESNDESIATVSTDGVITAVAEGNTTITVSWKGDDTWVAGSATIDVEVKRPLADPGLSFRHAEIRGKLNVGVAAQAAYHVSPGKITYSSSNEAVVKVNPNTGMIIPANVFAVGEANITASIEATEEYRAATATYKIIIENPAVVDVVDDGPAMFDFRKEGCYGFKTNSYSGTETKYEYDFDNPVMSIQEGVVRLTFEPESQFRSFNGSSDTKQLRIYGGAKFSFSVPEGYSIAKIVFNQISNKEGCNIIENIADGASALGTTTVDNNPGSEDSEVKSCREWIANDGVTASTVNFTMSTTAGHVRIRTISVQIKKADSNRQLPGLAFENRVYNTFVNEETPVNCATKQTEENVDIFYSIDNLTDDEYTIFAEENGELKVMVTIPGVYTLRAKSNPTETTLPGIAILRLNVFPKYDLAHNAEEMAEELMIVPAEGGKLNFNQLPSTLELKLKRSGDEEFTTHDGSELTFTDDETIEFYMLYAETYEHGRTTLNVVTRPTAPVHDQQGEMHQFAPSKGAYLYYTEPTKYAKATQAKQMAPVAEATWNQIETAGQALEVNPASFQMAENEYVRFQAKSVKKVAAREVEGPAQYFTILSNGSLSGVEDIEIEAADVRYFNLNGVAVDADALTPGIYIRHNGAKAEKVVIR